jgi:hypothetical protein
MAKLLPYNSPFLDRYMSSFPNEKLF